MRAESLDSAAVAERPFTEAVRARQRGNLPRPADRVRPRP